MSLSRAFQYAGAASVVHSLWKVPDAATSEVMVSFYKNLLDGQSKPEALRTAKLSYLQSVIAPEHSHPFYWAAYGLIDHETDGFV